MLPNNGGEPGLLHALPLIGGTVGSAGGPVGSMGLGAGAEAIRQLIDRGMGYPVPQTADKAVSAMGTEGLKQGIAGIAGIPLAKLPGAVGNVAMRAALRAGGPEAQAMLENGISATKGGLQKLNELLGENGALGGLKKSFLNRMTAMGVTHDPADIAHEAMGELAGKDPAVVKILTNGQMNPDAVVHPVDEARAQTYKNLFQNFYDNNTSDIAPGPLEQARRRFDTQARAYYKTLPGNPSKAEADALDPTALWNKAMANASRNAQNRGAAGLTALHPDYGTMTLEDVNGKMSALARAQDALAPLVATNKAGVVARIAQRSAFPLATGSMAALAPGNRVQHGIEGAVLGTALQSPGVMSHLALMLNNPMLAAAMGQIPRAAGAVFSPGQ